MKAVAPVPVHTWSPFEVRQAIGPEPGRTRFHDDARLVTPQDGPFDGRDSILRYLAGQSSPVFSFRFSADEVYRCGPDRGIEIGTYNALLAQEGWNRPVAGRWWAEWTRSPAHGWRIREARLHEAGRRASPPPPGCVSLEEAIRAVGRVTVSGHLTGVGYDTGDPHRDTEQLGRYPYKGQGTSRSGALLGIRYRGLHWLAAELDLGLLPRTFSWYKTSPSATREQWLVSDAAFAGLTLGYEGRDIFVGAGPALYRSWWGWSGQGPAPGRGVGQVGVGAVATLRVMIPAARGFGFDLLAQYRAFPQHPIPEVEPAVSRTHSGLFFGVGIGSRVLPRDD
jgi:hypothetical protein